MKFSEKKRAFWDFLAKQKGKLTLQKSDNKFPSLWQWKKLFKVFNQKEKIAFLIFLFGFVISLIFLISNFYSSKTLSLPDFGGTFREGIAQKPMLVNPLFISSQDADRDLYELIFSGLLKTNKNNKLIGDLAEKYEIQDSGKVFEVSLKNNLLWHDGKPLTADDVIFTIELIQEPQTQSPLLVKWMGIKAEKISDQAVRFTLSKPFANFAETLTLKILPKHIFEKIPPQELLWTNLSEESLIGSGPFQLKKIERTSANEIKRITLEKNKDYQTPVYLDKIELIFFKNGNDLLKAAKMNEIDGFSLANLKEAHEISNDFQMKKLLMPRYFAVFFNLNSQTAVSDVNVRQALALSVNKAGILKDVFAKQGEKADSPILPGFYGFNQPGQAWNFDLEKVKAILDQNGFIYNEQTKTREKIITSNSAAFSFTKNLKKGDVSQDVQELQKCLAKFPDIYPEAKITGEFGDATKLAVIKFQEKYTSEILTPIAYTKGTGDVKALTRKKLNAICFQEPTKTLALQFTLATSDQFPLPQIAEILKENWQKLGVKIEIQKITLAELQSDTLAKRNFDALLFGEALGALPDPFPFWHSSQKNHPGLNISSYSSKNADSDLEKAREAQDLKTQQKYLEAFQDTLLQNLPAIFIASPDYIYMLSDKVHGFEMEKVTEPAKRFSTVNEWYMNTKRMWK